MGDKDFDVYVKITIWNRKHDRVLRYYYDKIRSSGIDEEDAIKKAKITHTILKVCRV